MMSLPSVACIVDVHVILDRLQSILETAAKLTRIFLLNKGGCRRVGCRERGRDVGREGGGWDVGRDVGRKGGGWDVGREGGM